MERFGYYDRAIETHMEEKKRAEENIKYIVKIYMTCFGALFAYTGFAWGIIFRPAASSSFAVVAFSLFGLFLIVVIGFFGKYGVEGITHAIVRRMERTNDIASLMKSYGHAAKVEGPDCSDTDIDESRRFEVEHFYKIPGVYVWTSTAVVFGSMFYFYYAFGENFYLALSAALLVSGYALMTLPKSSIFFHNHINISRYRLLGRKTDGSAKFAAIREAIKTARRGGLVSPKITYRLGKRYRDIYSMLLGLFILVLPLKALQPYIPPISAGTIAALLLAGLMMAEFVLIKARTTNDGGNYRMFAREIDLVSSRGQMKAGVAVSVTMIAVLIYGSEYLWW